MPFFQSSEMNKEEFLKNLNQFHLGKLTTESFHSVTKNLSQTLNKNIQDGVSLLKTVDVEALNHFKKYIPNIYKLSQVIQETLESGNKVFISGCGATGRLALLIEKQFRDKFDSDQIIGFMAGGDFALIKSVESFEDKSEYGSRQLMELGFTQNDLLLGVTEGGETSFVLGTLEKAASLCASSFFIFCNPEEDLKNIKRSMSILENKNIEKLCLAVGPMALSGSTRMQATTVQLLAITLAIYENYVKKDVFEQRANEILENLININYDGLEKLIGEESKLYDEKQIITYKCNQSLALNILTDTTERSPTFSLASFEKNNENHKALCFLSVADTKSSKEAWFKMLGNREPRSIEWDDIKFEIKIDDIYAFDISEKSIARRSKNIFEIKSSSSGFDFIINNKKSSFNTNGLSEPYSQIALKLLLNTLSTSIMGLQGRYIGNMMTYVKPSNMKLIDRAVRYIQNILQEEKIKLEYKQIVDVLFEELDSLSQNESIVMRVLEKVRN